MTWELLTHYILPENTMSLVTFAEELIDVFGDDFAMMKGYSQNNPHHSYDLLEHTLRTVENIDPKDLSKNEVLELKIAALFHDIGKPKVARKSKDGNRTVFYNHAKESGSIAYNLLQPLNLDSDVMGRILFFIEHHDDFISFKLNSEEIDKNNFFLKHISIKTVYQKILEVQKLSKEKNQYIPTLRDFELLLRLCVADALSQSLIVVIDGKVVDTQENKLNRFKQILNCLQLIIRANREFCDLHIHSYYSDGTDSPRTLVEKATEKELRAIALTDHNTIDGLDEFVAVAKEKNIDVIPGVEFSTEYRGTELHVLGLFIQEQHYKKIDEYLKEARQLKEQSNILLIRNLKYAGYEVDYDELKMFAQIGGINRAVIARYLFEKGIISSVQEGFKTLLSKKNGYYISPQKPSTIETIKFIKSIGAVAILAHPLLDFSEKELIDFLRVARTAGLDGVETYYSLFSDSQEECLISIAKENSLVISGGSDYHGLGKPHISMGRGIGNLNIPLTVYLNLIENYNFDFIKYAFT